MSCAHCLDAPIPAPRRAVRPFPWLAVAAAAMVLAISVFAAVLLPCPADPVLRDGAIPLRARAL